MTYTAETTTRRSRVRLQLPKDKISMLQERNVPKKKVVTKKTASFAAQCLDVKLGEEVGYYYRGENKTNLNKI